MKGFPFVFLLGVLLLTIFSRAWAQSPSMLRLTPPTFQALPWYQQVFALVCGSNLWLEDASFREGPSQMNAD